MGFSFVPSNIIPARIEYNIGIRHMIMELEE